jgi:hypothetical protein
VDAYRLADFEFLVDDAAEKRMTWIALELARQVFWQLSGSQEVLHVSHVVQETWLSDQ